MIRNNPGCTGVALWMRVMGLAIAADLIVSSCPSGYALAPATAFKTKTLKRFSITELQESLRREVAGALHDGKGHQDVRTRFNAWLKEQGCARASLMESASRENVWYFLIQSGARHYGFACMPDTGYVSGPVVCGSGLRLGPPAQRVSPAPVSQAATAALASAQSDQKLLTPSGDFVKQEIEIPKSLRTVFSRIALAGVSSFTPEERDLALAWSAHLRNCNSLPTLGDLVLATGKPIAVAFRTILDLNAKLNLAGQDYDRFKDEIHQKVRNLRPNPWPDNEFEEKFAKAMVATTGSCRMELSGLGMEDRADQALETILSEGPKIGMEKLCRTMHVQEAWFTQRVRALNHARWLDGRPELAMANAEDSRRIQTGASREATQHWEGVQEALKFAGEQHGLDFFNPVMNYLRAVTDAANADYGLIPAMAEKFLYVIKP